MIKSIKVKKIAKDDYMIVVKGKKDEGKFLGRLFIRECRHCHDVFFTRDAFDIMCSECKKKAENELKDLFKELASIFNDNKKDDKKVKDDNKDVKVKKDDDVDAASWVTIFGDAVIEKDAKEFAVNNGRKIPHKSVNSKAVNNVKIVVPRYDEKYAWIEKNLSTPVSKATGLKIMELIARKKSLNDMAEILNLTEKSVDRYIYDLQKAGLVLRIRNTDTGRVTYEINPAVQYKLMD